LRTKGRPGSLQGWPVCPDPQSSPGAGRLRPISRPTRTPGPVTFPCLSPRTRKTQRGHFIADALVFVSRSGARRALISEARPRKITGHCNPQVFKVSIVSEDDLRNAVWLGQAVAEREDRYCP